MRYLLMICSDESAQEALGADEQAECLAEYMAFGEEMGRRGVSAAAPGSGRPATRRRCRSATARSLTADGPFAETKEQIGGYYLVDCKDLDEAIEVAAKIPGARLGTIEVRPIWEM